MITMNELVDLRMQQHIAHEIYRQQIMQRIPDPFPHMLQMPMPRHVIMPPRVSLPGVEATLLNDDLWKQFHQIGTEMIITKSGRRMFPSMRQSLTGLEEESNYCVLLEMVPIGDCRYKFSGSQWVPAGGAEPQSPQRMYLHPDSPATGAHWQAQPILFNKVKLTNNTLDNNGHIVLASMHKYQPRLHVIRTSDLTQIPWAPQQAFVFPETEFVAVTAYQNDRITKLKIDNNPFAKGFRETGQSRCKRKMSSSPLHEDQQQQQQQHQQHQQQHDHDQPDQLQFTNNVSPTKSAATSATSICSPSDKQVHMLNDLNDGPRIKRMRSNGSACSISSFDDVIVVVGGEGEGEASSGNNSTTSSGNSSPSLATATTTTTSRTTLTPPPPAQQPPSQQHHMNGAPTASSAFMHHFQQNFQQNMQTLLRPSLVDLACSYFGRPQPVYPQHMGMYAGNAAFVLGGGAGAGGEHAIGYGESISLQIPEQLPFSLAGEVPSLALNVPSHSPNALNGLPTEIMLDSQATQLSPKEAPTLTKSPAKKKGFSISAILDGSS